MAVTYVDEFAEVIKQSAVSSLCNLVEYNTNNMAHTLQVFILISLCLHIVLGLETPPIKIPMIFRNATTSVKRATEQGVTCGSYTCGADTSSCCSSAVNPCCTLPVGTGICCPDECYDSNTQVCCNPGGCTAGYPICCGSYCCQSGYVCSGGSCLVDGPTPSDDSGSGLSGGAIAGILCGAVGALVALIIGIVFGVRKGNSEITSTSMDMMQTNVDNIMSAANNYN